MAATGDHHSCEEHPPDDTKDYQQKQLLGKIGNNVELRKRVRFKNLLLQIFEYQKHALDHLFSGKVVALLPSAPPQGFLSINLHIK